LISLNKIEPIPSKIPSKIFRVEGDRFVICRAHFGALAPFSASLRINRGTDRSEIPIENTSRVANERIGSAIALVRGFHQLAWSTNARCKWTQSIRINLLPVDVAPLEKCSAPFASEAVGRIERNGA